MAIIAKFEEDGFSIKLRADTEEESVLLENFNKAANELGVVVPCAGFSQDSGHILIEIDSSKKKVDALIKEWRRK